MCSQTKLLANRLNAQKSTGPRTAEGKARSSLNSITHAAYCRSLVLPSESEEEFRDVSQSLRDAIDPRDAIELTLFERMLAARWKLYRLASREREFQTLKEANESKELKGLERASLRKLHSEDRVESNLEAMAKQEQRLENQFHKAIRELRQWRAAKAKEAKLKNEANEALEPEDSAAFAPLPVRRERSGEGSELHADELQMASVTREPSPQPSPGVPGEGADESRILNFENEPNARTQEVDLLPPTPLVG